MTGVRLDSWYKKGQTTA